MEGFIIVGDKKIPIKDVTYCCGHIEYYAKVIIEENSFRLNRGNNVTQAKFCPECGEKLIKGENNG